MAGSIPAAPVPVFGGAGGGGGGEAAHLETQVAEIFIICLPLPNDFTICVTEKVFCFAQNTDLINQRFHCLKPLFIFFIFFEPPVAENDSFQPHFRLFDKQL